MEDTKNIVYIRVTPKLDEDMRKSLDELKNALAEVEAKWDAFSKSIHRVKMEITPL